MKFDPDGYCGGVLPEEAPLVEKFEAELLPYLTKHGPQIGEMAMHGDADAEAVIQGYHRFINGLPTFRRTNFEMCVAALKRWERKSMQ